MEQFYLSLLLIFVSSVTISLFAIFNKHRSPFRHPNLPPGNPGLPYIGESLSYMLAARTGYPEMFVFDRIAKYSSNIFSTNLLCKPFAVLFGSAGNKFLFSNENKLVVTWWPENFEKILPSSLGNSSQEEAKKLRSMIGQFLKPEALQNYIGSMDTLAQRHFASHWEHKDQVNVLNLAKNYTFLLACKLFMSIEDPEHIARFEEHFKLVPPGVVSIPIDIPGTPFNKAIKAAKFIREKIFGIVKQRKIDLAEGKVSYTQDVLSHLLWVSEKDEQYLSEFNVANNIIALLIAGHDTVSTACTMVVKYLAELPHVYDSVYMEQMEIAKSKATGELLNWDDIQKMKYSWNVACEVLRLAPPLQGGFREAITDFTFNGFSIPKGWKILWSPISTHKNPEYFPEPDKFDPSRFEKNGPAPYTFIPFGGGPRMCPGKEYARLAILIFMHHLVKRFKFQKLIPDEKIVVNPMPVPAKGLPLRLYPYKG